MKKILLFVLTALLLLSCAPKPSDGPIVPKVRYELSGGAGHYDYAPSFIKDKYGIIYGFLCENRDPFEIVDYIYLYKGILRDGEYVWQPATQIIAPSESGWDCCHICDPDVREFTTHYKGETYYWIMTYLGVDQWDCNHNQIGLAFSKNIEGPYIKFDKNPLIPYEGRDKWGTGQSTTIVLNDTTIRVFYHSTTENGPYCCRDIELADLDHIVIGPERAIKFLPPNSYPAIYGDNIFMVSELRDDNYERIVPTWVGNECRVQYMKNTEEMFTAAENPWTEIGSVKEADTGFPRGHNPGFLTDTKGYLLTDQELVVYFTPAVTGEDWLWSYDLWSATYDTSTIFK